MNGKGLEETNSGVKKKGDIEDVAEFAREVEKGLEDEVSEESITEFNEWRPREQDDKKDIERKTVKAASLNEKDVEEKSNGVKDISEAGKKTVKAGKNALKPRKAGKDLKEASKKVIRPIQSGSRKTARGLEENVYTHVMTKFNPYFFDAKEFSADLRAERDGGYSMEVNVPDKVQRNELKENLDRREG